MYVTIISSRACRSWLESVEIQNNTNLLLIEATHIFNEMKKKLNEMDETGKADESNEEEVTASNRRKALYQSFTYTKYGYLGNQKEIHISNCVKMKYASYTLILR